MSIAPGVRRYQLYLKMKDKKLLPMNRQLIPLQSSCVRKCRRQHHPLPHRQHLLRLQHRRRHLLLHRQNRQKPEVLPVFRLKVGHRVRKQAIKTLLKNPKQRQNQRQRSRLRLGRRSLRQRRNPLPSRRCKTSRLIHADERTKENKLTRRLYIFADEFGIFPYMGNILGMFGASRSRNIIIVPCIQSPAQLRQTYGADGETIIRDCCQTVIFGGFSPMSDTAVTFSKLLGNQTVAAGSVSTNNREGRSLFGSGSNSSRSVNMIARPLMTPDELQLLPFGKWVVNRRGSHPFIANMPRYDKWGIRLEAPYISETREYVPTVYAKLDDVIRTIKEEKWRQTVQEKRESANPSESVGSTADY